MAKKQTMADKVREYTKANPKALAKDIAKALSTKTQYVHSVWYLDRKQKGAPAKKIGRPAKARTLNDILALPKQSTKDDWQIKSLEGEIANLKAVVRYLEGRLLEGRLYGASV